MSNKDKNRKALADCNDFLEPSMPDDEVYMKAYRYWRNSIGF